MAYEVVRFPYDGTIDADGHVLDSPTLWEDYLEPRHRARAIRIRVDDEGLEYLEIDGRPSERTRRGSLGLLGAMGDVHARPSPERRYASSMPFGAGDARERVELLARENLEKSVLPFWAAPVRFKRIGRPREFFYNVMLRQGVQQALLSFIALGTLDRFPRLRLGVLESGMGWIGSFLDRADAVAETGQGLAIGLRRRPSDYFREQCFISGDPDETAAPYIIDHVGSDCFLWATDYPHPDHPGAWAHALEKLVAPLSPDARAKLLGRNVARIYRLG
jgi:hypothetical protein